VTVTYGASGMSGMWAGLSRQLHYNGKPPYTYFYNITVQMIVFRLKQAKQESQLHKLSNSVVTNIAQETAFTITVNQATNINVSSSTSNRFTQDHIGHTSISQYNNTQLSGTTIDTLC